MRDLRKAYNLAWDRAEEMDGDFKDCLLHQLSSSLGMPILNEIKGGPERYTDGGVVEMGGTIDMGDSIESPAPKPEGWSEQ